MHLTAIDLGTNTLRVLILNPPDEIVYRKNFYLFLGNEIVDGKLSSHGLNRLRETLKEIHYELKKYDVKQIFAVATAFARKIRDNLPLKKAFREILDCELWIIDSETEGKIVIKAINKWFKREDFLVIDMGGGSTEFSLCHNKHIKIISLDIGSLNIKEMFFKHYPPNNEEKENFYGFIIEKLTSMDFHHSKNQQVFGVGGTITTIAYLLSGLKKYESSIINGYVITREQLERFCHKIEYVPMNELKEIFPLENGREKVLLSGSLFLLTVMYFYDFKDIITSDFSLLEGIIPYYTE